MVAIILMYVPNTGQTENTAEQSPDDKGRSCKPQFRGCLPTAFAVCDSIPKSTQEILYKLVHKKWNPIVSGYRDSVDTGVISHKLMKNYLL